MMRRLIYFLIIAAAASFFAYRQRPSNITVPPAQTAVDGDQNSTPPKDRAAVSAPVKETVPPEKPKQINRAPADQNTLNLIQQKINPVRTPPTPVGVRPSSNGVNEAAQAINDLEKPPVPPPIRLSQEELYNRAAARVVNFFCQKGSRVLVASGVIISPQGHILTNAHVAEDFDSDFECLIRQGSPARNIGYAKAAMFPKAFSQAKNRQEQADNDVSIWRINRPAGADPLPTNFPHYDADSAFYPQANQPLATFSYPSELLGYETLLKNLNLLFAETIVTDFDRDLILSSTGLSSQVGSSGGILVDIYTGKFAGLIFAISKDVEINKRKLFSLTPYSIERVVQNETGLTLADFLNQ